MELERSFNRSAASGEVSVTEKYVSNGNSHEDALLGIFFIAISLCLSPKMTSNQRIIQKEGKSSNLEKFLQSLPCKGISKLILTGISIILTVMISTENEKDEQEESLQCILHITIYISFSISGLLDILLFYLPMVTIPRHTDSFCLLIAFLVEHLAVSAEKEVGGEEHVSLCLVLAIWGCLVSSVMHILSSSAITTFSLMMFTQIQGTWLIHSVFMNISDKMTYLYFSWHVLVVFFVILVINVITKLHTRTNIRKHQTTTPTKISDTGLTVPVEHYQVKDNSKSVDNLTDDKIEDNKARLSDLSASFESLPTQILSIHSDNHERMSPLEEFNTLHRNTEGVRKSIMMKESSIV